MGGALTRPDFLFNVLATMECVHYEYVLVSNMSFFLKLFGTRKVIIMLRIRMLKKSFIFILDIGILFAI